MDPEGQNAILLSGMGCRRSLWHKDSSLKQQCLRSRVPLFVMFVILQHWGSRQEVEKDPDTNVMHRNIETRLFQSTNNQNVHLLQLQISLIW